MSMQQNGPLGHGRITLLRGYQAQTPIPGASMVLTYTIGHNDIKYDDTLSENLDHVGIQSTGRTV